MITQSQETRAAGDVPVPLQWIAGLIVGGGAVSAVMAAAFVFWGLL